MTCLRSAACAATSLTLAASLHAQELLWADQLGTTTGDVAQAVAPDGVGGVFVGGVTNGALFPPSSGSPDAWLARYDAVGSQVWAKQFGSPDYEELTALASDGAGGVFAAGDTNGSAWGPPIGSVDGWLHRYDAGGTALWTIQFGTVELERVHAAAPDGAGGVFLAGYTNGSFGAPNAGGRDAWLGHWLANGALDWVRQWGTVEIDEAVAVVGDGQAGVFVGGHTVGALGGPAAGGGDLWIAHVDAGGSELWMRQMGSSAWELLEGLALAADGGPIAAGSTFGAFLGTYQGQIDAWTLRLDPAGDLSWGLQFGTPAGDTVTALTADGNGGVVVGGYGAFPGWGPGGGNAWLARVDAAGSLVWDLALGSPAYDAVEGLATLDGGRIAAAGVTQGVFASAWAGDNDAWVALVDADCGAGEAFCSASQTSIAGCAAQLSGAGSPSLAAPSGFTIASGPVPGGNLGLVIFGANGTNSTPIGTLGGLLCVAPPFYRSAPKLSGGSAGLCDGAYAFTLADLVATSPVVTSGATLAVELWSRDPANADGFLLSDGWTFTVCP